MKRIAVNSYVVEDRVDDLACKDVSLTQQHCAEDCDVNEIVARAARTGILGDPMMIANKVASFGDFSGVGDYKSCLDKVLAAQQGFLALPLDLRTRFDNDPGKLLDFIGDPANFDECVKLGIFVKKDDKPAAVPAAGAAPADTVDGAATDTGAAGK